MRTLEFSVLAKYAFGLAQMFNAFYHRSPILNEEDADRKRWRAAGVGYVRAQLRARARSDGHRSPGADVGGLSAANGSHTMALIAITDLPQGRGLPPRDPARGRRGADSSSRGDAVAEALDGVHGLLLTGGDDVEPARYGAARHATVTDIEPARDAFEIALILEARQRGSADPRHLPRHADPERRLRRHAGPGHPLAGARRRDTRLTVPPNQPYSLAHEVWFEKNSLLGRLLGERFADSDTCEVNSRHHQAVKDVAPGFVVTATAPDGIIEAIEDPSAKFCLGVQWHPENFWRTGEFRVLFEGLVRAAEAA